VSRRSSMAPRSKSSQRPESRSSPLPRASPNSTFLQLGFHCIVDPEALATRS
jgi:hypothetical protein